MPTIRTITSPSIYVVGRQSVDAGELARFLGDVDAAGWTTDAPSAGEALVEVAGRSCYQSFKRPRPGGNSGYLDHILEVGHGSVVEHAGFNFIVAGVSRSLTHQLTRHRAGFSYSELSQRFVDSSDVAFVVPPEYLDDPLSRAVWEDSCASSLAHYQALLRGSGNKGTATTASKKQAREAARSVLPESAETKIFISANVRSLRHFLEMRGSAGADAEIRRLALALLPVLRREAVNLFSDYTTPTVDGVTVIHTDHRKV